MICSSQPEPYLEMKWYRGNLTVLSTNKGLAILIDKADRADQFWEMLDCWIHFNFSGKRKIAASASGKTDAAQIERNFIWPHRTARKASLQS